MLLAPALFAAVFELTRVGTVGPLVDRPRADLSVGIIVLVLGRGFAGLVMLAPLLVGAGLGVGPARRLGPEAPARCRRPEAQVVRTTLARACSVST